ncbi:MAG: LysR family transcriptional regulator [Planctomycetes bacterium]|nr:LysR family transcriptional regulator [Planctomycetota bacterium]
MQMPLPSLSTDQVAAFVELARQGSLRSAAEALFITEQGVRNRLVALEQRLGAELYFKSRGPRTRSPLTAAGRRFLPHATAFLEQARELTEIFAAEEGRRVIHVAATQYLILYVLIEAVRSFHNAFPHIQVRLSNRIEQEIEAELLSESDVEVGVAAPYEASPNLEYTHLFSMNWSVITPPRHPLQTRGKLRLKDLAGQPLILLERGSTGRRHVIDAFHGRGLSPRVEMETTNTEIIVRMVEAGLGVSIVPLMADGSVTRGRKVAVRSLGRRIEPIHSGILTRRGEPLSAAAAEFVRFVQRRTKK